MAAKRLNKKTRNPEEFESDTQKIIHRHLENENDVISEEDIRNVRIGMVPPDAISTNEEAEERMNEEIEEVNNSNTDNNDTKPNDEPITSYDIME